ncbi:MAG: GNAT family N-acetyltransferase [Candidatus Aceula meridiana]|nr:GNAT family N-acetyltransferase [Candidatus Aceula meridiana]
MIFVFFMASLPGEALAQASSILGLPQVGSIVPLSPGFTPPIIRGMRVYPNNPLKFDFIVYSGDSGLQGDLLKQESEKLIRYFLASLTIPEDDLWVNLSPYEKDRIVPDALGQTEMGRDMLAQDYLLKQVTASLIYPEDDLGKQFWQKIYKTAYEKYGTTNIPVDTFNKVWIVPQKAVVYARGDRAFITESKLKVMLEEDYLALANNGQVAADSNRKNIASQIIREIVIPELEKEINEGQNFAQLRQIYHSLILAYWFKNNLKDAILNKLYSSQEKIKGVDVKDKDISKKIYNQYIASFKKGVCNMIKIEYDAYARKNIPRKYFSGGLGLFGKNLKEAISFESSPSAELAEFVEEQSVGAGSNIIAETMISNFKESSKPTLAEGTISSSASPTSSNAAFPETRTSPLKMKAKEGMPILLDHIKKLQAKKNQDFKGRKEVFKSEQEKTDEGSSSAILVDGWVSIKGENYFVEKVISREKQEALAGEWDELQRDKINLIFKGNNWVKAFEDYPNGDLIIIRSQEGKLLGMVYSHDEDVKIFKKLNLKRSTMEGRITLIDLIEVSEGYRAQAKMEELEVKGGGLGRALLARVIEESYQNKSIDESLKGLIALVPNYGDTSTGFYKKIIGFGDAFIKTKAGVNACFLLGKQKAQEVLLKAKEQIGKIDSPFDSFQTKKDIVTERQYFPKEGLAIAEREVQYDSGTQWVIVYLNNRPEGIQPNRELRIGPNHFLKYVKTNEEAYLEVFEGPIGSEKSTAKYYIQGEGDELEDVISSSGILNDIKKSLSNLKTPLSTIIPRLAKEGYVTFDELFENENFKKDFNYLKIALENQPRIVLKDVYAQQVFADDWNSVRGDIMAILFESIIEKSWKDGKDEICPLPAGEFLEALKQVEKETQKVFTRKDSTVFVIRNDEKIVGFIRGQPLTLSQRFKIFFLKILQQKSLKDISFQWNKYFYLGESFILDNYQRGLGIKLFQEIRKVARRQGYKYFITNTANPKLVDLYQKIGTEILKDQEQGEHYFAIAIGDELLSKAALGDARKGKSSSAASSFPGSVDLKDNSVISSPGGIDLKGADSFIETRGEGIEFDVPQELLNMDPAQITGFMPVIINIIPVTNFSALLGLSEAEEFQLSQLRET